MKKEHAQELEGFLIYLRDTVLVNHEDVQKQLAKHLGRIQDEAGEPEEALAVVNDEKPGIFGRKKK